MSDKLYAVSSTWVTLSAFVVFLLFSVMVLPAQSTRAAIYANGVGSPDTSLFYSANDLYDIAQAYGEQGRTAYVRSRFTFDLIWPWVYTLFLTTAVSWVHARGFDVASRWKRANVVPVLGATFDYLENVSTSIVLLRYPDQTAVVDALAPVFTLIKWALISGSFALLLVGILISVWRWIRSPE